MRGACSAYSKQQHRQHCDLYMDSYLLCYLPVYTEYNTCNTYHCRHADNSNNL